MTKYDRDLSNMSYTNKDFGSIFPELLELAKKLSYKWNPIESDESDPGVVLLKLAALMADKDNYNIDKNILELFPMSVTQLPNARQIYDQCGYTMRYYQAATATIAMSILASPFTSLSELKDIDYAYPIEITVPKYAAITDLEHKITYTTTSSATLKYYTNDKNDVVKSESVDNVTAIQGGIYHYTINNSPNIMLSSLDYDNRLYFSEKDIAENGIYISNVGESSLWSAVDNLYIQQLGEKCFKFGIDPKSDRCYVEFPSDMASLIGSGITLSYIRTSGRQGRVRQRVLNGFLTNPIATVAYYTTAGDKVTLGSNGVPLTVELTSGETGSTYVTNRDASNGGADPETVGDAYKNYQRVKNTFDTLVTLKDYSDYMVTKDLASNGFVCDRTNDIQSTYTVMEHLNGNNIYHTIVKDKYVPTKVFTYDTANQTYSESTGTFYEKSPEMTAFALRVYPTIFVSDASTPGNFVRSFKMSDSQYALQNTAGEALRDVACINHDFIGYETDRILMIKNKYPLNARIIPHTKLSEQQQREVVSNVVNNLYEALNARKMTFGEEAPYDEIYDVISASDARIKALALDDFTYHTYAVYLDSITGKITEIRIDDESSEYLATTDDTPVSGQTYYTKGSNDTYTECSNLTSFASGTTYYYKVRLWRQFRRDIFAKSVMAGVTPLFERSNVFTISAQHDGSKVYNKAFRLTTSTESNMVYSNGGYQCTVRPNENLIFTSPNLITKNSYSNYCKYLIYLNGDKSILAKSEYTLQEGEYICFFYKPDGAEYYHYVKYSEGTIIVPSITIRKQDDPTMPKDMPPIPWTAFRDLDDSTSGSLGAVASGITDNTDYSTLDKYIDDLCEDRFVLSTTSIEIKDVNSVTITDSTRYMCWILNTTTTNSNGESVCRLFSKGTSLSAKYILQSGEYILYSNDSRTQLHLLGSGTQITVEGSGGTLDYNMDCPIVDYNNLISFGIDYLKDVWQEIPKGYMVTATEMQFIQLGEGNKISMTFEGESEISGGTTLTMKGDGVYANGKKLDLTNVSIAYSNGDSYSYLSNKNSDELAWNIRYVLNINSSPITPQKLVTGQRIRGVQPDKTEIALVGDNASPLYIESNRSVSILGGENVDVSVIDLSSGDAAPLQLYAYKMAPQSSGKTSDKQTTAWVVEYSAGLVCLSKVAGNGERSIMTHSFGIPKGCYVFELTTESSDSNASFTITSTDATLTCISTTSTTFKSPGKYYFTLKVTGENPSISIITTKLMSCWVGELVPIEEVQSDLSNILNENETLQGLVCSTMATLDVNGVFNYSHIVNDSSVIKQPLSAESFLLSSHIYNPFTICEWDITNPNDTIKVITKIRG